MTIPGRRPTDSYYASGNVSLGIDVSVYQGAIDWARVARAKVSGARDDRVRFAFIRLGDGRSVDANFERNFRGAGDAGIKRGTYRYFRAREGGRNVAELDARLIEKAGGFGLSDLRCAVDLEINSANDESGNQGAIAPERVLAEARAYLERMEELTNRRGIVYSGAYIHSLAITLGREPHELTDWPIWSPAYTRDARVAAGWDEATFWQWTPEGRVDGIPVAVDLDYFRGGPLALAGWAGASARPPFGFGGCSEQAP